MKPIKITLRTQFPHNYDTNEAGDETGIDTGTEGGAKQSFKEECDINTIVKRFGLGYEMPPNLRLPEYGDFTGINDFHTAANAIARARENFELLHADIRSKFDNDPGKFVDFATDDKNREQLKQMGLLSPEAIERDRIAADAKAAAAAAATIPPKGGSPAEKPAGDQGKKP